MKLAYQRCVIVLLPFIYGCIPISVPSVLEVDDKLLITQPLEKGDTILLYGDNAVQPDLFAAPELTMGCMLEFHRDTVRELGHKILMINPDPGRFAIRRLSDLAPERPLNLPGGEPILRRWGISETKATDDRLRYVVYLKERVETTVYIPLYIIPFGVAACGVETILEASIWEWPSEKVAGTLTISAKGNFVGLAFVIHLVVFHETQKDATRKLAALLVEKLTGLKPVEMKSPQEN